MKKKCKQKALVPKCTNPRLQYQFLHYLSDNVSKAMRKKIENHVPDCESCQDWMEIITAIKKGFKKSEK